MEIDSDEDQPIEGFKGFEKVAKVSLYSLVSLNEYLANKASTTLPPELNDSFFNCRVKLHRDDLEDLQKNWKLPFACDICYKRYETSKKLKLHKEAKHLIVRKPQKRVSFSDQITIHDSTQLHKCRKCCRLFLNYLLLKKHMRKEHKKRRLYICHYCTKSFAERSIFKIHIKLHCFNCNFLANNRQELSQHKLVCQSTNLSCPTCNTKFPTIKLLKDHCLNHIIDFQVCNNCKKQFETKCSLLHHQKVEHEKLPTKELFKTVMVYGEKLYSCNYCDGTFDSETIDSHINTEYYEISQEEYSSVHCINHQDGLNLINKTVIDLTSRVDVQLNDKSLEKLISNMKKKRKEDAGRNKNGIMNDFVLESMLTSHPIIKIERLNPEIMGIYMNQQSTKSTTTPSSLNTTIIPDKTSTDTNKIQIEKSIPVVLPEVPNIASATDSEQEATNVDQINPLTYTSLLSSLLSKPPKPPSPLSKQLKPPKEPAIIINKRTIKSKHQCNKCNNYFSTRYCLNRHIKTVHEEGEYRCGDCGVSFTTHGIFSKHKCQYEQNPVYIQQNNEQFMSDQMYFEPNYEMGKTYEVSIVQEVPIEF